MKFSERLTQYKKETGTTYKSMYDFLEITRPSFHSKIKGDKFKKAEKLALEVFLLKEKPVDYDTVSVAEVHVNGEIKDVYTLNMSTVNAITLFNSVNTIGGREVVEIKLNGDKLVVIAREATRESEGK